MVDTLVWLVDNSNILSAVVNKTTLGPNPPIELDTTGLSILMPGLKKYPNRGIIFKLYRRRHQNQHIIIVFLSIYQKWPTIIWL